MAENPNFLRVAVIIAKNSIEARQQLQSTNMLADAVELRLDCWEAIDIEELTTLRQQMTIPVIFTLRKISQGGQCTRSEPQRLACLHQLAALTPEYLDVEYDTSSDWLHAFRNQYPHIQLIGSYHNFTETPADLSAILTSLQHPAFDIYKIATFAQNIVDTLRLLIFLKAANQTQRLVALAMGEYGEISRILAPVFGSLFTYGCLDADTAVAPGQLTLKELTNIYRVQLLNQATAIYALLGDPISQSPGHLQHNHTFSVLGKNAVYVKCRIQAELLPQALILFRQLPFNGFSVTIPHKETVVALVDELQENAAVMKIVNTIQRVDHRYFGWNTDASGAVNVLEAIKPLKQQKILILGAGGSGKAIAYALLQTGVEVSLCNRTLARAQAFTHRFGGTAIDFAALFTDRNLSYDIIINTLPADAYAQQCANWQIPATQHGIAMDIILKPLLTPFLQSAKAAGWHCLTGAALFNAQAACQLKIWFAQEIPHAIEQQALLTIGVEKVNQN